MQQADRLHCPPWVAAGIPQTAGHGWWLHWAGAAIEGEDRARAELRARDAAFAGTGR